MKPLKLAFSAFGPFVERQEIDFTVFEGAGVFLIHGETGAGKTVILDAMTYALYGKSSGGVRGELAAMRCQFADESQPTEVLFEFELQNKRYRFTRGLKIRKKRDGGLEYLPQQDAFYYEKGAGYVPFFENPRIRDVEEKAQELLGLGYEQFIQVVILPQGKFERLLLAKSEEKEKILVSLFRAERWQKAAELLCRQVNEQKRALEQKQVAVQQGLAQFGCADLETLADLLAQKQENLLEKQKQQQALLGQWEQQGQQLQQAQVIEQVFCNLEEKEKQWKRLQLRQLEMKELEKKLGQAKKVQQVLPLYERWRQEKERAAQLQKRRNDLLGQYMTLQEAENTWKEKEAQLEKGRASYEKMQETLKQNELIEKQYSQMEQAAENQAAAVQACTEWQEKLEQCGVRRQRLQQEREHALQAQQLALVEFIAKIPEYRQKCAEQEALLQAAKEHEQQQQELVQLQEKWEQEKQRQAELQKTSETLEQHYQGALHRQMEETAQRLAEQLQEGQPCPVCGSCHHPAPAKGGYAASTDDVEQLRQETAKAREAFLLSKQAAETVAEKLQQQREQYQGGESADSFSASQYRFWQEMLNIAQAEEARRDIYEAAVAFCSEQLQRCQLTEEQLQRSYQEAQQKKAEAERQFVQVSAQAGGDLPDLQKLRTAIEWQRKEIQQFEQQQQQIRENLETYKLQLEGNVASEKILQQELEQAEKHAAAAQETWEQKLAELQITWREELLQEQISSDMVVTMEQTLQDYQIACRSCHQALTEYQKKLAHIVRPNVAQMEEELQELHGQYLACAQTVSVLEEELQRANTVLRKMEKELAWLREQEAAWQQDQMFAHMLRGDTGVSLQRYVLGVMLSSITAEANKMLQKVHDGRYRLLRTMEKTGRTRKAGLELEVFDQRTGMRRSVASLSGGEKFLVSLSLSLGLSAVVQTGCGGIQLQAMFIDEGFGTLDESSIADALQILAQIRHAGGMVGVISHVQVLKENIHSGIEVSKYHHGSELKTIL